MGWEKGLEKGKGFLRVKERLHQLRGKLNGRLKGMVKQMLMVKQSLQLMVILMVKH